MRRLALDEVLHQTTRVQIMMYLYLNRQTSVTNLREVLQLTPGNASTHISRLVGAGYVEQRRVLGKRFELRVFITEAGASAFRRYAEELRAIADVVDAHVRPYE